jgi:hypothetical protein
MIRRYARPKPEISGKRPLFVDPTAGWGVLIERRSAQDDRP